jgi:hypothetical protein
MSLVERAVKTLGLRQKSYQNLFAEGGPNHHVLVELALYSNAYDADPDDINRDRLMMMHGRRQMFFHIVNHLKLSPNELEGLYLSIAARQAARFPAMQGED